MNDIQQARAADVTNALRAAFTAAKLPLTNVPMTVVQVAHETGGFNSRVSQVNNMSGIKYRKGSAIPGEYDSGIKSPEKDNYSGFDNVNTWARRYVQIVNRGSKPLEANNIEDFAYRLKKNGYFTDTLENYTKGLQRWAGTLKKYVGNLPTAAKVGGGLIIVAIVAIIVYFYISKKK